ncbi:MAG: hypothetical protein ACRELB_26125 [Polyangiaceae bacterium]
MNAMTKKLTKGSTLAAVLSAGQYGTPQPQIEVRFPASMGYRLRTAALHCLAAEVEAAAPAGAHWNVEMVDGNYEAGFVYLELVDGTKEEADRGMAVLRQVIA